MIFSVSAKLESKPIILLGDSQTEFVENPLINNRSFHGSPFFVHYKFIKKFKNILSNKTIVIAFNYHHFSKLYENRLYNDSLLPGWSQEMIKEYFAYDLVNIWDLKFSKLENFNFKTCDFNKSKRLIKELLNLSNDKKNTLDKISNIQQINGYVFRHWRNDKYTRNDFVQDYYLKEIIKELRQINCKIYFLKTPLVNEYKSKIPTSVKIKYWNVIKSNPDIQLIDLDHELNSIITWCHFKDYGHLNALGDILINKNIRNWVQCITDNEALKK